MNISDLEQSFILHLGEMGSRWGINRTVGQIYALMFLKNKPICADDIAQYLGFSRSNISNSLKELLSWRLIKLVHLSQDRRDFYSTPNEVWDIFKILLIERKKREIEPTLSLLRNVLINNENNISQEQQRMQKMLGVVELASEALEILQILSMQEVESAIKIFKKIQTAGKLKRFFGKSN